MEYNLEEKDMFILDVFVLLTNKGDYYVIKAICGAKMKFRHSSHMVVIDYKKRLSQYVDRREVKDGMLLDHTRNMYNVFTSAHLSCCYNYRNDVKSIRPKLVCSRCISAYFCDRSVRRWCAGNLETHSKSLILCYTYIYLKLSSF